MQLLRGHSNLALTNHGEIVRRLSGIKWKNGASTWYLEPMTLSRRLRLPLIENTHPPLGSCSRNRLSSESLAIRVRPAVAAYY